MRVLIADKVHESMLAELRTLGCGVVYDAELNGESLVAAVRQHDPDVIVVRSTKVGRPVVEAAGKLSLIIRAGSGYDTIDVDAASSRSIFVANCPGMNAIAVAELTWGLILACDRRIPDQAQDLRVGAWNKKEYSQAGGLFGKTLGIIGVGRIGELVARRGIAFGMKVICYSPSLTTEKAQRLGVHRCQSLEEVARLADVVTIHCAASESTRHMIGESFCDELKPGAILVNCARASVVDEAALTKAVHAKGVRAGLDVFEGEPAAKVGAVASPLFKLPGLFGTHHVGASTDQAQAAVSEEAVRIIQIYKDTGTVLHCVNMQEQPAASSVLSVAHRNHPGVLATVLGVIADANINIEEMQNVIYKGQVAATARIWIDAEPDDAFVERLRTCHKHIVSVDLHELSEPQRDDTDEDQLTRAHAGAESA